MKFVEQIKAKLQECCKDFGGEESGVKWLGYLLDMLTSCIMDGALGLLFHFIDSNIMVITIAAALLKMNDLHSSANVAAKLLSICKERFGINLQAVMSSGASNTANTARAFQSFLGIDQSNCMMHVVSLLMSYTIRMRENYMTNKSVEKDGKEVKVTYIVTPGGAFSFGAEMTKVLKEVATYFGSSPQCKEDYEGIKKGVMLPAQNIKSPGETQVSSMNHYALTLKAMQAKDETFKKLWEKCKN